MLETLVSSRIRRSLFEYLLAHPNTRFYLRGLAKELSLSVSPLRRELKRLEHAGVLRTEQEANLLFYAVNTQSPTFLQLQHVSQQTEAPSASLATQRSLEFGAGSAEWHSSNSELWTSHSEPEKLHTPHSPSQPVAIAGAGARHTSEDVQLTVSDAPSPQPVASAREGAPVPVSGLRQKSWTGALPRPALVGAAAVGMALMLIMASLFYLTMTNRHLVSQTFRELSMRHAAVTVVTTPASSSGTMRGARWQIVPGGFGGFSSSANSESY